MRNIDCKNTDNIIETIINFKYPIFGYSVYRIPIKIRNKLSSKYSPILKQYDSRKRNVALRRVKIKVIKKI
jgi:hypothetical protein